jgi:hypothetical protein
MTIISAKATIAAPYAQPDSQIGASARPTSRLSSFAVVAGAAFGLYWLSSFVLQARYGITHFGADGHIYTLLADGIVVDRLARFHPVTIAMAAAWMKVAYPLTLWLDPHQVLKAIFAAVGAVGVWAAMSAFAAVIPRRYAILFGIIYAISLSVWFFSSIEESKIVTASLSALYIARYLHLRKKWTTRGVVLLTAILMLGCLNEIVFGFLVIIPVVDTLMQRGLDLRHSWWIAAHALAGPIALLVLEFVVKGHLFAAGTDPTEASHWSLLVFFVSTNDFSAASLYSFVVAWLFFNIAAPTPDASYGADPSLDFGGNFEPALANYFSSPVSVSLVAVAGLMVVASVLPRYRSDRLDNAGGLLLALLAYALLRGAFFLVFNSREPLLNSSAVTLAHLLIIGIPFAASSFPAKRSLLVVFAVLLFIANGAFIFGR